MNQYIYFALGIVLGISLAVYYFMNREEKIEDDADYRHETEHKNPCHGFLRLLVVHENSHDSTYR